MTKYAVVFLVLCILTQSLQCADDKLYIKVIKESVNEAEEESFIIRNRGVTVVESPMFAEWETEIFEYCIPKNADSQYTLVLRDDYPDSWSGGSWLEIQGIYGNIFFKNMMTKEETETYALSLYYAIEKDAEWKVSTVFDSDWTQYSFDDAAWSVLPSSVSVSETQYLRKRFLGMTGMAAYEARIQYQYGIVVYVNGVEVFRDNLPDGAITKETPASGGYPTNTYHSFIRPGLEVASPDSIMAIELHFLQPTTTLQFNAFVALLTPTAPDTNCFIVSEGLTVTTDMPYKERIFDFDKETFASKYVGEAAPIDVFFAFSGAKPFVNGLRIWPYSQITKAPQSFTWSGKNSEAEYHDIMNIVDATYTSQTNKYAFGFFGAGFYRNYRLHVTKTASNTLELYEVQPLVCAAGAPTSIEYSPVSYTYNALYDEVNIRPVLTEFTNCTIRPALPAGLTLDSATCVVSGTASAALPSTAFTVTSAMNGRTYEGSFTLLLNLCATAMVDLRRIYQYSAGNEYFSIKNSAGTVVYSIDPQSTQRASTTTHTYLCLPEDEYTIHLNCVSTAWMRSSFLYIDLMLSPTEKQTIARARHDSKLGLEIVTFSTKYAIPLRSTWYYKMNEVPASWFDNNVAGWAEGSMGSFPDATNTIQLYKYVFPIATLPNYAGVVLSLRYKFGCVIYVNSHEVFRNGVVGDLSTSSVAENIYTDLMYRVVSLPSSVLQQGANTLAIAIVSTTSTKTSFFDCSLRYMPLDQEYRVLDEVTITSTYSTGGKDIFDDYNGVNIYQYNCNANNVALKFQNDRREWINAVVVQLQSTQTNQYPRTFSFEARNTDSDEWVPLRTVGGMTWSQKGQAKKIWIPVTQAYNQYRFRNFGTENPNNCYLRIGRLAILTSSMGAEIPALKYAEPGEVVSIFKDIEMAEMYPNSDLYYDFAITPALPEGITLDVNSGVLSGTASAMSAQTTYTITAKKMTGETVQVLLPLKVDICTGEHSLMTLVARTDAWPSFSSYKLFQGKTTEGTPYASNSAFAVITALNYVDWCLPNNIYTLQLVDSRSDGWDNPAGYYLTIDMGEVKYEMGQVPDKVPSVSTLFSSYLPFQVEYSDWSFFKGKNVDANWKNVDFDASAWESGKAAAIGPNTEITSYVRKEFAIPSLEDYAVLNVRVKYAGGVVAFLNGHKVARFNLEDGYTSETPSIISKSEPFVSVFHVVLNMVEPSTEKNVIAFEIHHPRDQPTGDIVFDATGVFGVNECSIVLDSYASVTQGTEKYFDLTPATYGSLENKAGVGMEWTVENMEGTRFNAYAWQTANSVTKWGFSLLARKLEDDDNSSILALLNQSTQSLRRNTWNVPVGIAGFRHFKYETDSPASSSISFSAHFFLYCRVEGAVCPGIGEYPPVAEGQISPGECGAGFHGYSYRTCNGTVLSEVKTDTCVYNPPSNITYAVSNFVFVRNTEVATDRPSYVNIITEFYISPTTPLPQGLSIDATTGVISGVPVTASDAQTVIVYGTNPKGTALVEITIAVRNGQCLPDGEFDRTDVGKVFVYECAMKGNYVGQRKRACVLGKVDGEWQEPTGFCLHIAVIVVIIVVVVLLIVLAVVLIIRSNRKKVGGRKKEGTVKEKKPKTNAVSI